MYTTIGWLLQAKQAAERATWLVESLQASIESVKEQPGAGSQVMQHVRHSLEAA